MQIYLQTFGARLRVKDGLFEVIVPDLSGSNHHVTEQFAGHQVKSVLLQPGSSVSADALLLALEHGADIIVLDAFGNPRGRLLSNRPNSTLAIWKKQLAISLTPDALRIAKGWVEDKIRERLLFLQKLKRYRDAGKQALIAKAETETADLLARLSALPIRQPAKDAEQIRGIEGHAGQIYYNTLNALLPEELRFSGRSQQPAQDLFNAFLNYGYGILYNLVEKALVLAGLHPHIGWMHYDGYQRKSLVFDYIEPWRIWVEKTVFALFAAKKISGQHVRPAPKGKTGLWLNDTGCRILADAFLHRLRHQKTEYEGRLFSLEQFLSDEARRLAALVLRWSPPPALLPLFGD